MINNSIHTNMLNKTKFRLPRETLDTLGLSSGVWVYPVMGGGSP